MLQLQCDVLWRKLQTVIIKINDYVFMFDNGDYVPWIYLYLSRPQFYIKWNQMSWIAKKWMGGSMNKEKAS